MFTLGATFSKGRFDWGCVSRSPTGQAIIVQYDSSLNWFNLGQRT